MIRQYCAECKKITDFIKVGFIKRANGQKVQKIQCKTCGRQTPIIPAPKKPHKPYCKNGDCYFVRMGFRRLKNRKVEQHRCTRCGRIVRIKPTCPKCGSAKIALTQRLQCQDCGHFVIVWTKNANGWIAR